MQYFYPDSLNIVEKTNWLLFPHYNMKVLDKMKRRRNHARHNFMMLLRQIAGVYLGRKALQLA